MGSIHTDISCQTECLLSKSRDNDLSLHLMVYLHQYSKHNPVALPNIAYHKIYKFNVQEMDGVIIPVLFIVVATVPVTC